MSGLWAHSLREEMDDAMVRRRAATHGAARSGKASCNQVAEPSIERAQEAEPPSQRDGGSAHEVWTEVEARPRRKWHRETFACAFSGHVVPAAHVAELRPEDAGLGLDLPDGRRFARCLRCDAWVQTTPPRTPQAEYLPPID